MLALIGSLATAREAGAQRREYPVRNFAITDRSGEIGFQFDYLKETQTRDGGDGDTEFSNTSFQEYVLYRLRGYVYHPRFLDWRASVKLGLLQQIIDRSGTSDDLGGGHNSNTGIGGFDVQLHFLKEHPYSLLLSAARDRSAVLQLFTDEQIVESDNYGAVFNWKKGPLPWDLSYSRSEIDEFGAESRSESINQIVEYTVRNQIEDLMHSELRYRFREFHQEFEVDDDNIDLERKTDLESQNVSFFNSLYLSRDRRSFLNSQATYFNQTGSQELENFFWQETLRLQLTPTLLNYYQASLLNTKFEESETRTIRGEAGIEHRLYRSLESHFDIHGRKIDFDGDSEENEYGATVRFNYRKDTPWGVLTAGYGRTLDMIERKGQSSRRTITDESITFLNFGIFFLENPGVIAGSIEVTDAAGLVIFDEGFDYEVEVQGNRTGLRLLAGGRLAEGDTVLVDYDIRITNDVDWIQDDQTVFARHAFNRIIPGLAIHYRYQNLEAIDPPEDDDFTILEFTDQRLGFTYDWRWLRWTEEYQRYRANFGSFDQVLSQLEGNHRVGDSVRLGWSAGYLMIDFMDQGFEDESDDQTDVLFADVSLNGRFGRNGFWEIEGRARDETGLTEETLLGILARAGTRWRQLRVECGASFERRERFETERDRAQVFLQVAREF